MMSQSNEIMTLLRLANQGNHEAANQLFRLVETELRKIAANRLRKYQKGLDVSTTVLVDDAFCRVIAQTAIEWNVRDRKTFFAYAAKTIERLLIDMVKAQQRQKREGRHHRADGYDLSETPMDDQSDLILDLMDALDRLEAFAPEEAFVFRLRYFLNCTFEETSEITGLAITTVKTRFTRCRLWLQRELRDYQPIA